MKGSYHSWPCPRPPRKKNSPGCINSCTSCHLSRAARLLGLVWWRWLPASNREPKTKLQKESNCPSKFLRSGHCAAWEMWLLGDDSLQDLPYWKKLPFLTLPKASSKNKTVLSESIQALNVTHCAPTTRGSHHLALKRTHLAWRLSRQVSWDKICQNVVR